MHGAPPVRLTCGNDAIWRMVHRVLAALAAATVVYWVMGRADPFAHLAPAGAAVAAGLGAWLGVRLLPSQAAVLLDWDGRGWSLDGRPGEVVIALDFGAWMLLRFLDHADGRVHWLPVSTGFAGATGQLGRAALHAHAGATAGSGR